jgi:hypothetical protein
MKQVYTRNDWNQVLADVNYLCNNPPPDCTGVTPLPLVGEKHRWSVADIQSVRNKLLEICPDNSFTVELRKWKQAILDEIGAAIVNGWCKCCDPNDEKWQFSDYEILQSGTAVPMDEPEPGWVTASFIFRCNDGCSAIGGVPASSMLVPDPGNTSIFNSQVGVEVFYDGKWSGFSTGFSTVCGKGGSPDNATMLLPRGVVGSGEPWRIWIMYSGVIDGCKEC